MQRAAAIASSRVRSQNTLSASPLTCAIAAPAAWRSRRGGHARSPKFRTGAAANRDQRHIAGFGLHALDVVFQLALGINERDGWLQQDL
jgi:hypothetical protein